MIPAPYKMKFLILISLLTSFSPFAFPQKTSSTDGMVTFTVRTVTNNGTFSPYNVLAIWVKDVQGNFVISRKVMANARKKHLVQWVASSGNSVVNAVTGATLSNHQKHTINWDCRDQQGNLVPDGEYEIFVEFTERNSSSGGAAGPSTKVTFNKATSVVSLAPADEVYFKEMQLDYVPLNVGIKDYNLESIHSTVFPNPFTDYVKVGFTLPEQSYLQISVYDETGRRIKELVDGEMYMGENTIYSDGKTNSGKQVSPGMYYLRFYYRGKMSTHKIVKTN